MGDIEIRDFDGDLDALSEMAKQSWFEEYGINTWPDLYKPKLAAHLFADVKDPQFLIGAYDGSKLVGFLANLPRNYRVNGQSFSGAMSCMLVGHKEYRRRHVILDLIKNAVERNQTVGLALLLITLEEKHRSSLLFEKHLKNVNRIEVMKKLYPIVHPIDFEALRISEKLKPYEALAIKAWGAHRPIEAPTVKGKVRPYQSADLDAILKLTQQISDRNQLVRVFDKESLGHQLDSPEVTSTLVYEVDSVVKGFVNWTLLDLLGKRGRFTWAWLDYLYWQRMSFKEKKALLSCMWYQAKEQGCIAIMEWSKDYYKKAPLFRSRFVAYPRFLGLNTWIFDPKLNLHGVKSYFDQQL